MIGPQADCKRFLCLLSIFAMFIRRMLPSVEGNKVQCSVEPDHGKMGPSNMHILV
jgi:hypothetical protein